MAQLNEKRAQLKAVEDKLANLKQQFTEMTEKKEKLEFQVGLPQGSQLQLWTFNITDAVAQIH